MIGAPRRIRRGMCDGEMGVYWAWPVDGYWDVHHAPDGVDPDGSEVVSEQHTSFADARAYVRDVLRWEVMS